MGHAQWVFVIPKMLRPYFLHHRELLGGLARAVWETVLELMCAAVGDEGIGPGMVAVVQTAGDLANWHPHVHALVSRGGWSVDREWVPVAFVDERSAELINRTYEVEPLVCPSSGGEMQVIAFIIEHEVVDAILRHLKRKEVRRERAPPS